MSNARPARILILDDEPDVLDMLGVLLSDFNVTLVEHGIDAVLKFFQSLKDGRCYDLLILDAALPHFDAFTIAGMVRAAEKTGLIERRVKIAVFTAHDETVDRTTLVKQNNIDAYWKKVDDVNELPELVRGLLARP